MSAATLSTRVVLAAENPASSVDQAIASWKRLVGTPTIDLVAGDHRSILHPPAAAQTARSLEQALREIPDRAFRVDDFPD